MYDIITTVTQLTGYTRLTTFTFSVSGNEEIYTAYWNVGEYSKTTLNKNSISIEFVTPGTYTCSVSAFSVKGNVIVKDFEPIVVTKKINDRVIFRETPSTQTFAGCIPQSTFVVDVTSTDVNNPIIIDLHAVNSNSIAQEFVDPKWEHLTPTWRFLDVNKNYIKSAVVEAYDVVDETTGKVYAKTGTLQFYYVDDTPSTDNTCPLLLLASLRTNERKVQTFNAIDIESFANSNTGQAILTWQINDLGVDRLKITSNGIIDIDQLKWKNVKIPFTITTNSDQLTSKPLLFYPANNSIGNISNVSITLSGLAPSDYDIIDTPRYFQRFDTNGNPLGGFIFGTIVPKVTSAGTRIIASTNVNYPTLSTNNNDDLVFNKPTGSVASASVWMGTLCNNTAYKITNITTNPSCSSINNFKRFNIIKDTNVEKINFPTRTVDSNVGYRESGVSSPVVFAFNPVNGYSYITDVDTCTVYVYNTSSQQLTAKTLANIMQSTTGLLSGKQWTFTPREGIVLFDSSYNSYDFATFNSVFNQSVSASVTHTATSSVYVNWGAPFEGRTNALADTNYNHSYLGNYPDFYKPTSVSVDRFGNLWMTLSNTNYVITITPELTLKSVSIPNFTSGNRIERDTGDFLPIPAVVEVDRNNQAIVAYTTTLCSTLVRFDTDGSQVLNQVLNLGNYSKPVDLAINVKNQIWVAQSYDVSTLNSLSSCLKLYSPNFAQLSSINIPCVNNIALDRDNNVWFTFGRKEFGVLHCRNRSLSSWTIDGSSNITQLSAGVNQLTSTYTQYTTHLLGGISTDVYNRLHIIDGESNNLIIHDSCNNLDLPNNNTIVSLLEKNNFTYSNNITDTNTSKLTGTEIIGIMSRGDWTGNKWLQKFSGITNNTLSKLVSGISQEFKINDLASRDYKIVRTDDGVDMSLFFKDLGLTQTLQNSEELFNSLLPCIIGKGDEYNSLGREVYDKIANFTLDHAFIDTAGLIQLGSILTSYGLSDINDATFHISQNLPGEIKNLMNLVSQKQSALFGNNIREYTIDSAPLDVNTAMLTSGQTIFVKSNYNNFTKIVTLGLDKNNTSMYGLSGFSLEGFATPFNSYYKVYNTNISFKNINSTIDWSKSAEQLKQATEKWYSDGGIVEGAINRVLTKNIV